MWRPLVCKRVYDGCVSGECGDLRAGAGGLQGRGSTGPAAGRRAGAQPAAAAGGSPWHTAGTGAAGPWPPAAPARWGSSICTEGGREGGTETRAVVTQIQIKGQIKRGW